MGESSLWHLTTLKNLVHKLCETGDLMLLICHMTPHDHMLKGLSAFMGGTGSQ